jgi:polysaccharide biosynthesis/export protein
VQPLRRRAWWVGTAITVAVLGLQPSLANTPTQAAASRSRVVYDSYILGPGDTLQIELLDIPELSGTVSIGPDGTLYLPRLRALYVEGLTVEELRYFLTEQFKRYVRQPEIYIRPVGYRPIRIYVGGEVKRPGYYTLTGEQFEEQSDNASGAQALRSPAQAGTNPELQLINEQALGESQRRFRTDRALGGGLKFPTVFDAIRSAEGITPFSNLSEVQVTRRQPVSAGGGKIRTQLNFLSLITNGDESQNIRLFDGDAVSVNKSPVALRDQLLKASETNLNPQYMQVYVSGRVKSPGAITLPQGSTLNQALSIADGPMLLRGKVEFIRFTREGELDRRQFAYNPNAASDSVVNPILMAGDIIRVQESALSAGITVMNEITGPLVGLYSAYSLFR